MRHKIFIIISVALLTLSVLIPINESNAQRYNNNYNYQVMQQQQRQQEMMRQQRQAEANRRAMEQQRRQQEQMRRDMQRQRDAALQRQRQMQQQMQQRQQQAMLQRQRMAERQNQMALKRQQNLQAQQRQSQNALKQQNQQQQRLALQQQRQVKIRKDRINRIKRERDRTNKNQKKKAQAQTLLALSTTQALRLNNNTIRAQLINKNPSQFKKQYQADQQKSRQLQQTLQLRKNAEIKLQKSKFLALQLQKRSNFKRADKAKKDAQKAKLLAQQKFSQCKGGECKLRTGNCSFHGDTLVKTKDGYEPIKSLKVGEDWVWSRNEFTGEMGWKPITALFSNSYPETVEVTVTNPETNTSQVIRSNRIHEFYVSNEYERKTNVGTNRNGIWTQAQNLQSGDLVFTHLEKLLPVENVTYQSSPLNAYNITVDSFHTYFVKNGGESSIWVHNACNKFLPERARFAQKYYKEVFGKDGKFSGKTIDEVSSLIKQGKLSLGDIKIEYISRGKNQLILNTRSAQALLRAGIPMSKWVVINKTGVSDAERRLDDQLKRNRLTNKGTKKVKREKYFEHKR